MEPSRLRAVPGGCGAEVRGVWCPVLRRRRPRVGAEPGTGGPGRLSLFVDQHTRAHDTLGRLRARQCQSGQATHSDSHRTTDNTPTTHRIGHRSGVTNGRRRGTKRPVTSPLRRRPQPTILRHVRPTSLSPHFSLGMSSKPPLGCASKLPPRKVRVTSAATHSARPVRLPAPRPPQPSAAPSVPSTTRIGVASCTAISSRRTFSWMSGMNPW